MFVHVTVAFSPSNNAKYMNKYKQDMMSGMQRKLLMDSRTILYTISQQQNET